MGNIILNKISLLKLLLVWSFSGIISLLLILNNQVTYFLLLLLFVILSSYFLLEKKIVLFNPFTLFVIYSYSVILATFYLINSQFENATYINEQTFSMDIFELLNISLVYIIVSYIFAYLGYITFRKNFKPNIDLYNDGISLKVVNFIIIVFALLAIANFSFNVYKFAGGNPFTYIKNISIRHLEFESSGGTTLLYHMGYVAGYLWLYKLLKEGKKISTAFFFILFVLFTVFIKATTGRIFGTLSYFLSYFFIYYFVNFKTESENNRKYVIAIFVLMFSGLFLYFFRITSSLSYNNQLSANFITTIFEFINFDSLMYYAVDKGNIPNISVLMKIIDGWGSEIPFLYGESLFNWIYGILPSSLRPEGYQPSILIKEIWYPHISGGALPPMGMGEMFANFGYFGAIFGMFIFGMFVAIVFNLLQRFNNYWYLVMFSNISVGFILLYSKGEFDNLSFLYIVPIGMTYVLLLLLTKLSNKKIYRKRMI